MDLALDPLTGDLKLTNGDLTVVKDADAVAQFLRQKLKLFQTEWFLDESVGVPFFDQVFVKNPKQVIIDTIFKREILNTPGVVELLSYSAILDGPTRKLTLTFQARAKDGLIDFSETIEV